MYKLIFISLICFSACQSEKHSYSKAENAFDAGREFVDAGLKGDFGKAGFYMLKDSVNQRFLEMDERDYRSKDRSERQLFRTASINIHEVQDLDSTRSLIHFSILLTKRNGPF